VPEPSFLENKHTEPLKTTVVPLPVKVSYIISDIDKALAFEWIALGIDRGKVQLSFILLVQQPPALQAFLEAQGVPCTVLYYRNKKDLPLLLGKVYRLLRAQKPDAVHCHLLYGALVGLTAARITTIVTFLKV
jgi:hypothetical protein